MQTYQNRDQLKTDFLAQITAHEQADALVKGDYGHVNGAFRGCAIGCSVYSLNILQGTPNTKTTQFADHDRVSMALGIPLWLAYMEESVRSGWWPVSEEE